jgi:hypothetical protein
MFINISEEHTTSIFRGQEHIKKAAGRAVVFVAWLAYVLTLKM